MTAIVPARALEPPPTAGRRPVAAALTLTVTLVGVGLAVVAVARMDVGAMGDTGLISIVGPLFLAGVALLTVAFFAELATGRPRALLLGVQVVALVVLLHGVTSLVEAEPRFPTAWLHVGFVDEIVQHGRVLPAFDARYNWPGAFTLGAFLTKVAGVDSALTFVRWAPLAFELAYLLPVWVLAASLTTEPARRWSALWLFVLANWVGQDYFSPQALNYLLYLVVLAIVVRHFRPVAPPVGTAPGPAAAPWARARELLTGKRWAADPVGPTALSPRARVGLVAVLVTLVAASTVSHQLSPLAILFAVAALTWFGRCQLRSLPFLIAAMVLAWFSLAAEPYWVGHLDDVIGGIGQVGSTVHENVGQRLQGSPARLLVVRARLLFSLAVWALAALGAWRSWRARTPLWTAAILFGAPFCIVALQSYGGEGFLRIYLYALPFAAVLGAAVLAGRRLRRGLALLAVASIVLVPGFLVARYGNERFEHVTTAERQLMDEVYARAPEQARLIGLSPSLLLYRDIGRYQYPTLAFDLPPAETVRAIVALPPDPAPIYVVLSRSQESYGEIVQGQEPGWIDDLADELVGRGFHRVFTNAGGQILERAGSSG